MASFRDKLEKLPTKSLLHHASKNHFSNWLAVRCEFSLASQLRPIKVDKYNNLEDLRNVILNIIDGQYDNNSEGKIVQFKPQASLKKQSFVRISTGSLGGKARGLAFANNMIKGCLLYTSPSPRD